MPALRILIVDDNAIISELIAEILESLGHEICGQAATEADAISAATTQKPDLMIVDARLGQRSGVEAMAHILRGGPMPHLFISGASVAGARPDAVILRKPFVQDDLERAMQRAMLPPKSDRDMPCQ